MKNENQLSTTGKLKSNYHLLLVLVLIAAVANIFVRVGYSVDDYTYMQAAVCSPSLIVDFMKWHYLNYNGRTLAHVLTIIFLRYNWELVIWKIICAVSIGWSCMLMARIATKGEDNYKRGVAVAICVFATVFPLDYTQSIYWLTGSFNYFFPTCLLLLTMMVAVKKPKSNWIYPLCLISSITVEQIGMMTFGLFVLLILNEIIRKKKIRIKNIICALISLAGCLSIILAPGTSSRMDNQGGTTFGKIIYNAFKIYRVNWLDNVSLCIMIFSLTVISCIWLYKLSGKSTGSKCLTAFIITLAVLLETFNMVLKIYLWSTEKVLPKEYNAILALVWFAFAILFALIFLYDIIMIYIKYKAFIPCASVILAVGSQVMMIVTNKCPERACLPAIFFLGIFEVFSVDFFINEHKKITAKSSKTISETKRDVSKTIISVLCIAACVFHAGSNYIFNFVQDEDKTYPYNEVLDVSGMKQFETQLTNGAIAFYSDPNSSWNQKFDLLDFTRYDILINNNGG